jgi:putative spermidine/putrescine transport system permease protein
MATKIKRHRQLSFYLLTGFFAVFILFLYGPIIAIFVLSFQGETGGMTFPMRGTSTYWFNDLFGSSRYGDVVGAFKRSITLGLITMLITVLVSFFAGLAFRQRFLGSGAVFYLAIISLVIPGILVSLGIGQMFQTIGISPHWLTSGLGAHLSWTLPFGLLIMFAVLSRFDTSWEEAARDAGASAGGVLRYVTLPILYPGMIAVALFGLTLSYDELPRSLLTVGTKNTLPIHIATLTANVTTRSLYAIGTLTTTLSLVLIGLALIGIGVAQRRRRAQPGKPT